MGRSKLTPPSNNSIALDLCEVAVDNIFKKCVVKENSTNKSSHILFRKESRFSRKRMSYGI